MDNHFFKSLKIENFRGISSLEVDGLARVNLFVGRNNCGKTSVLEAMFLLTGMSNPELFPKIEEWRGLILKQGSELRDFFYNQKHEDGFVLSGNQETGYRKLSVYPLVGNLDVRLIPASPLNNPNNGNARGAAPTRITSSAIDQSLTGLELQFDRPGSDSPYIARLHLGRQGEVPQLHIQHDNKYKETILGRFLHRGGLCEPSLIDSMLNEKRKDEIVKWLQSIEPKVHDIRIGLGGVVAVDIGLDHFLPINHLGDGLIRILAILASIHGTTKGIFLVDEVENGLHVASIKRLWEMVLQHSKQTGTQVFMTTHSQDVIEGLRQASKSESIETQDSAACFWLKKCASDQVKAYRYSTEELDKALNADIDIRH